MGSRGVGIYGSKTSRLASSRAVSLATALQVVSSAGMEVMGGAGLASSRLALAGGIALQKTWEEEKRRWVVGMLRSSQSGRVYQAASPRLTCVEQEIRVVQGNSILRPYCAVGCSGRVVGR